MAEPLQPSVVFNHLMGETTQLANDAHTRIDQAVSFGKLHLVATVTTAIMMLSMLFGGLFAMNSFQKSLDKADAKMVAADTRDADFVKQAKAVQDQLASDQAQIAALSQAQAQKQQVIVVRDQTAAAQVAQVTRPDTTAPQAVLDLTAHQAVAPGQATVAADGQIEVTVPAAQQITATAIQRDQLRLDLDDTKSVLADERQKSTVCAQATVAQAALVKQCTEDVAGYKTAALAYQKAAKKSKFKVFLGGAEKVGLFLAGAYLGHKL